MWFYYDLIEILFDETVRTPLQRLPFTQISWGMLLWSEMEQIIIRNLRNKFKSQVSKSPFNSREGMGMGKKAKSSTYLQYYLQS